MHTEHIVYEQYLHSTQDNPYTVNTVYTQPLAYAVQAMCTVHIFTFLYSCIHRYVYIYIYTYEHTFAYASFVLLMLPCVSFCTIYIVFAVCTAKVSIQYILLALYRERERCLCRVTIYTEYIVCKFIAAYTLHTSSKLFCAVSDVYARCSTGIQRISIVYAAHVVCCTLYIHRCMRGLVTTVSRT